MLAVKLRKLQAFQMSEAISKAQAKRVKLEASNAAQPC
jgi:hypothetical protein